MSKPTTIKTMLSAKHTDMATTVRARRYFASSTDAEISVSTYRRALRRLGLIPGQTPRELLAIDGNTVTIEIH